MLIACCPIRRPLENSLKHPVRLLAISISIVSFIGLTTKAEATDSFPSDTPTSVIHNKIGSMGIANMHPELVTQLRSKKGGSIAFWEAVSWCETNHKWNDGGYYSGGLGMAQSVWVNYGGKQFAPRPSSATKEEQIIIANRTAFFGFQTKNVFGTLDDRLNNKPFFRPAVGWRSMKNWGGQCANWKTRKPLRDRYTEKGIAEWKESRNSSGKVSTQSVADNRSCPQYEKLLKKYGLPVKDFSYIMWRESRCQEKIVSKPNSNGTKDYGLLQINSSWRTVTRQVCGKQNLNVLLDRNCNLRVAKYLYENGGIAHWKATSGKK